MKTSFKVLGIVLGALAVLVAGAGLAYRTIKAQGVIEPYTLLDGQGKAGYMIATQDSKFKKSVLGLVKKQLEGRAFGVSVVDVSSLERLEPSSYQGLVILTTVQSGDIPRPVQDFLKANLTEGRIRVFLTADSRTWKKALPGVDAMTTASRAGGEEELASAITKALGDFATGLAPAP